MKKLLSFSLCVTLLLALCAGAWAETPKLHENAVTELYSAEGIYTDSVGNVESYSYHVPQINADTPDAVELNREIAERYGESVKDQFHNMEDGYSLWSWNIRWHPYWHGDQLFLLLEADFDGDFRDFAAYGYDFEKGCRLTNERILAELDISEETYLENLREKVQLMFEGMYGSYSEADKKAFGYDKMLESTLGWLDMEQPMFLDGTGQVETIVKIASIAGAGWYYHLATPFAYG